MKTKKPPDIIGDYFKCTKLSLKHVLKNPDIIVIIKMLINLDIHKIVEEKNVRLKNTKKLF